MRSGCLFLNNRYHDPTLGTFISVDPLVQTTGEPYIYASGSPATLSDPSGLCPTNSSAAAACYARYYRPKPITVGGSPTPTGGPGTKIVIGPYNVAPIGPCGISDCPEAGPPSASSSCGGSIGAGCVIRIRDDEGGIVEIEVPDLDVPGLDLVLGGCATGSLSFIAHLGVNGCTVYSDSGNSVLVSGEVGTGAGIAGGVGLGGLVTNADEIEGLLGYSVCGGASGTVGAGIEGSLCLGLTGLRGAEFTGTWSFYGGASFGAGAEGHVSLVYTHELVQVPSFQCNPIAYTTPLVGISLLTC